jgi:DNA invertase Pin-like site-specific DNA recombinase
MIRAVFYARVSTQEEQQLKALPKQIEECRDCIKAQGWALVDEYIDEGKSGTRVKGRDEYRRLMDDIEAHKFDVIVVKSQDRLQRSAKDWYIFVDKIVTNDVRLYMYLENTYYTTDNSLITGIKAILAEEYSRDLSKKLNNANKRRIEKALRGGEFSAMGTTMLYGYTIEDCRYVVVPEQAEIVKLVYQLYLEYDSVRKVRDTLNLRGYRNQVGKPFCSDSISRMLKNEHYKGMYVLNRYHRDFDKKKVIKNPPEEWVCIEDAHEAIIDKETWDKVNERIASKRGVKRGRKVGRNPLSGKLFCASCGGVLWKHKSNGYENWYCSTKYSRGMGCDDPSTISSVTIRKILQGITEELEVNREAVKKTLLEWLRSLRESLSNTEANNNTLEEINRLENRKKRLTEAYLDEILSKADYKEKYLEIEASIRSLKETLAVVDNDDLAEIQRVIDNIDAELDEWMDTESFEDQKIDFLIEHIHRITVCKDNHLIIELDLIGGAIIAGKEFFLFVSESMPFPHG